MNAHLPRLRLEPGLGPVEMSVLWAAVYASLFRGPVPRSALRARLCGIRASEREIEAALAHPRLAPLLDYRGEEIWLRTRDVTARQTDFSVRRQSTQSLVRRHHAIFSFLSALPGVRLAAVSGGCAHDASDDGDIDVFLVTEVGHLWRSLLTTLVVSKARGWRRVLCLNYAVDASAQSLPGRDFYSAFELISLRPFAGSSGLADLLAANPWALDVFPNFVPDGLSGQNARQPQQPSASQHLLEATARMIHRPYLRRRLPRSEGVELSEHAVRLHSTDHRPVIRGRFRDALDSLGLEAPPWI